MKFYFSMLAFFMLTQLFAQPQHVDKVIAVVGNQIILQSDIEAQIKLYKTQMSEEMEEGEIRAVILDQLLANSVLLSVAKRDSVEVTDQEVQAQLDARVNEILTLMRGDINQFEAYYNQTPEELKEFMRDQMHDQILQQRMQQQLMSKVTVTPHEVKAFFARIPKDSLPYFPAEVELSEIIIKPKVNEEEEQRARQLAREILIQIIEDTTAFAGLAKKYSDDPGSGALGGELGVQQRGTFVPAFEAAAFQLRKGELSDLVRTEFGYHLIQLNERLGNSVNTRHILIRPEITEEDKLEANKTLDSIRTLILSDSMSFGTAVRLHSENERSKTRAGQLINMQTRQPSFSMRDLPMQVYFAIENLNAGEVSQVIETKNYKEEPEYQLIRVLRRTAPHEANLTMDYEKIKSAALQEKQAKFLKTWVDKQIASTFIQVKFKNMGAAGAKLSANPLLQKWQQP